MVGFQWLCWYICHGYVIYIYHLGYVGIYVVVASYIRISCWLNICHGCVIYVYMSWVRHIHIYHVGSYIYMYNILVVMDMLIYIHIMVGSNMYICNILAQCSS